MIENPNIRVQIILFLLQKLFSQSVETDIYLIRFAQKTMNSNKTNQKHYSVTIERDKNVSALLSKLIVTSV